MKEVALAVILAVPVAAFGAESPRGQDAPAYRASDAPARLAAGIQAADAALSALQGRLAARLLEELKRGGPARAIAVCRDEAPALTGSRFAPAAVVPMDGEGREAVLDMPDPRPDPEQELDDRRLATSLEAAIGALDPKHREILVLRDVEGLTAPEVAEVTGLGVEAVKSRLHRARVQVRERLAPLLGRIPAAASTCPDVLSLLSCHLEDEIDPATCAEMERHLAACPRCEAACDSLKRVLSLCRGSVVPDVLLEVAHRHARGV